ncbi:hypothetical protein D9M73_266880 [compost metagenome]
MAEHDFGDVGFGQGREIRARGLAQVVNRPVLHFIFFVPTQPLHYVVGQLQGCPYSHRLVRSAVREQVLAFGAERHRLLDQRFDLRSDRTEQRLA